MRLALVAGVLLGGCLAGGGADGDAGVGAPPRPGDPGYPGGPGGGPCGTWSTSRAPEFVSDGVVCPPEDPPPDPPEREAGVALREVECPELLSLLQDQAIRELERSVEANRAAALRGDFCYDYHDAGACDYSGWYADGGVYADAAADYGGGGEAGTTPEGPEEYSGTNNQVPGVDEADFLKTDGQYIYILADGRLQIIDSWPPEEARVVSSHEVEGEPTALFYWEDRVLAYSALGSPDPSGYGSSSRCTYGYDCDFTGDGRDAKLTVFDVSDRAHPRLLRELRFSGSYINSRRIEGAVFTVLHLPVVGMPSLPSWPAELPRCPDGWSRCGVERAFDELLESNRAAIRAADLGRWVASVTDTVHEAGGPRTTTDLLVDCRKIYASDLAGGDALLAVVALDSTTLAPPVVTSVLGRPGATYATADALYVAARHTTGDGGMYFPEADGYGDVTTIHKFALDAAAPAVSYVASGVAEGRILNQFSMDEYEGRLRIATTSGWLPDPGVHSTLSVLEPRDGTLTVVGKIDDIAPTEDIRAVRFDGPRGFIVTFKKTDPLFALDLADPANPRIAGELHIPGFSTYMHRMDDTHLLTIGYDADEMGSFAYFDGIQLQIFDVADLTNPLLLHREVIGTRGSTSDAATDHLAFNYFPPREALAIPMVICEGGGSGTFGSTLTFSGLLVYRVTTVDGFDLLGRVAHADPAAADYGACSSWWSESNSPVQRSIFMDDYVYSVAADALKVNRLDRLGEDLAVVPLVR
jgi:uncharacterized secreted protein with C-terminal beta-propeller domain